GYVDPGLQLSNFENWQKDSSETLPSNGSAVLVDYIDQISTSPDVIECNGDLIPNSLPGDYTVSPPDVREGSSFFACIRDPSSLLQQDLQIARSNQDVYVFLRGDASARSSSLAPASETSRSPVLQTQVLIRGVVNKNPTN
ncbi:MAG: hypothetical protein WA949_18995, partial [Phormidesmis sp.]